TTLHITFTGFVSGTYVLTYSTGTQTWNGTATLCGGAASTLALGCTSGIWELSLTGTGMACAAFPTSASSASCSPLNIVFHLTGNVGNCCPGQNFTATVTT